MHENNQLLEAAEPSTLQDLAGQDLVLAFFAHCLCQQPSCPRPPPIPEPATNFSLELVFPGAADLGGEALGQLLQAAGILQLDLSFPAEELLQVLQQLQPRL